MDAPALDLVNSEWWYGRGPDGIEDQLLEPAWVDAFLERWGFAEVGSPTARQRRTLSELRALLRRLVTGAAAGETPAAPDLDELNRISGAPSLHRRVTVEGGELTVDVVPERRDWRWVCSEIATSFAELLQDGEYERIKLCANGECLWAFYDESKNRRRRWCGSPSCGDLDKVRRFRERQRAGASASPTASARSRRRPQ